MQDVFIIGAKGIGNYGGYETNNALRVVGSSYVTGTSYTNSGVTVTSDKNKKNSIVKKLRQASYKETWMKCYKKDIWVLC